jgi:hypothetical protein
VYSRLGESPSGSQDEPNILFNDQVANAILEKNPYLSPEERAKLKVKLAKYWESEVSNLKPPTRYEHPAQYWLMIRLAQEIEEAASLYPIPLPILPAIGTLPTGRVNAMAIAIPKNDEYLVVFESELFTFALLLSKVVAQAVPFQGIDSGRLKFTTDISSVERCLAENPVIVGRFRELMFAYLLTGHPSSAPPYILEEPYLTLSAILRDSMELFVMGHEYGHIIRGHLLGQKESASLLGEENVDEITRSWEQELEADAVGLQLLIPAMQEKRRMDLSLSYWGADLFFSCSDILERGISILLKGQPGYRRVGSHPFAELRRKSLRNILGRSIPENASQGPIKLGMIVEKIMELLWNRIEVTIYELHKRGASLAPIWR